MVKVNYAFMETGQLVILIPTQEMRNLTVSCCSLRSDVNPTWLLQSLSDDLFPQLSILNSKKPTAKVCIIFYSYVLYYSQKVQHQEQSLQSKVGR